MLLDRVQSNLTVKINFLDFLKLISYLLKNVMTWPNFRQTDTIRGAKLGQELDIF